jgi:carboxyl-terminal processing protease
MRYFLFFLLFFTGLKAESEFAEISSFVEPIYTKISETFEGDINQDTVKQGILHGLLTSLDPYCEYLSVKDLEIFQERMSGNFAGIGVVILPENGLLKVVSAIEGTPAYKAGLKSGDYIVEIDKESIFKIGTVQGIAKIRGDVGSSVELKVIRKDAQKPLDFRIKRDNISTKSVSSKKFFGNFLYIKVNNFIETTANEVKAVFNANKGDISGVLIDLRDNPGGSLEQAVSMANLFVKNGSIVSIKGKNKNLFMSTVREEKSVNFDIKPVKVEKTSEEVIFKASNSVIIPEKVPIAVLINKGSASASEIFAGAIQDLKRGIILGETSFGKGAVQQILPINGGKDGAIKITTAKYYTPEGRLIQDIGIKPDVNISQIEGVKAPNETENSLESEISKYKQSLEGLKIEDIQKEDNQLFTSLITLRLLVR